MSAVQIKTRLLQVARRHFPGAFLKPEPTGETAYETHWDTYAQDWRQRRARGEIQSGYPGDEWDGYAAGLDLTSEEYSNFVFEQFIDPYVPEGSVILEIGAGGGRMTQHLIKRAGRLVCCDISAELLEILRRRFNNPGRISFLKTRGADLSGVETASIEVVFSWATFIRLRPYDIYAYLLEIERVLKPNGLGIIHHSNILSALGWAKFREDAPKNTLMRNDVLSFSVMAPQIMEKFMGEAGLQINRMDTKTVPRDCVTIFRKAGNGSYDR